MIVHNYVSFILSIDCYIKLYPQTHARTHARTYNTSTQHLYTTSLHKISEQNSTCITYIGKIISL